LAQHAKKLLPPCALATAAPLPPSSFTFLALRVAATHGTIKRKVANYYVNFVHAFIEMQAVF